MPEFKFLVHIEGIEGFEGVCMTFDVDLIDIISVIKKYVKKHWETGKAKVTNEKMNKFSAEKSMLVYETGSSSSASHVPFIPYQFIEIKEIKEKEGMPSEFFLSSEEMIIATLDPTKMYTMIIRERGNLLQRTDLIRERIGNSLFNVIVFEAGSVVKSGFAKSLTVFFAGIQGTSNLEMIDKEGNIIRVFIDSESGKLLSADTKQEIALQNFMAFNISAELAKPEISAEIVKSFFSDFKKKGENEKERLISYVRCCHNIRKISGYRIYAPIINIYQSSGSGKSRLASELMQVMPSAYVVLRESGESGYPQISQLTNVFFMKWIPRNVHDDYHNKYSLAASSIVGNYILLIRAILEDYVIELDKLSKELKLSTEADESTFNAKRALILNILRKKMIGDKFFGENLVKFTENDKNYTKATIEQTVARIKELLGKIKNFYSDPFVLIIDEASLLAEAPENDKKSNKFRLFRRALHCLGSDINIIVLTLGTNSDIRDLNPEIGHDSFRESNSGFLFPPFIVAWNWDIFLNIDDIVTNKNTIVSYDTLKLGKMIVFLLSRGRPIWGSLPLGRIMETAKIKITNNSLESGEAYLAFWLIRTGILVNPSHAVTKKLVKSLMATVLHLNSDMKAMRVYYPSEPILAMAARKEVTMKPVEYHQRLLDFLRNRAIDSVRIGQIIAMDIFLQAIDRAICVEINWESTTGLPKVCERTNFILENDVDNSDVKDALMYHTATLDSDTPATTNLPFFDNLDKYCKVCTVGEFLKVFREFSEDNLKFVPRIMLEGLVNASHFIQFGKTFPTSTFPNTTTFIQPVADSTLSSKAAKCDILTSESCQELMMQQAGGVFPPGYFGADFWIPVCLKDKDQTGRPVFTAILVQVKKGSVDQLQKVVAKCELSTHFVRCAAHGDCQDINCAISVSDSYMCTILENQLSIVVSLGEPVSPSASSKYPKTKYQIYQKQIKEDEETKSIGSKRKKTETADISAEKVVSGVQAMDISNSEEEASSVPKKAPKISEYFKNRFESIKYPLESEVEYSSVPGPFEATRFVPEAVIENQISESCSIYGMASLEGRFKRKMTCLVLKGKKPYVNILREEVNPIIEEILNYDGSIFHGISSDLDKKELADAVISRNTTGGIQIADNLYRKLIGLDELPDILPSKYFDDKSDSADYIDLLKRKIG